MPIFLERSRIGMGELFQFSYVSKHDKLWPCNVGCCASEAFKPFVVVRIALGLPLTL